MSQAPIAKTDAIRAVDEKKPSAELLAVLDEVLDVANATQSYAFQVVEQPDESAILVEAGPAPRHTGTRPAPTAALDGELAEFGGELYRCQPHQRDPDESKRPTWVLLAEDDRIVTSGLYGQARATAHGSARDATQAAR